MHQLIKTEYSKYMLTFKKIFFKGRNLIIICFRGINANGKSQI